MNHGTIRPRWNWQPKKGKTAAPAERYDGATRDPDRPMIHWRDGEQRFTWMDLNTADLWLEVRIWLCSKLRKWRWFTKNMGYAYCRDERRPEVAEWLSK